MIRACSQCRQFAEQLPGIEQELLMRHFKGWVAFEGVSCMPSSARVLATVDLARAAAPRARGGLFGRRAECEALGRLLNGIRGGKSRALMVHGQPGIGTTALLTYAGARATGCRVIRASGVEAEMELHLRRAVTIVRGDAGSSGRSANTAA
jgi:hypothetical protein